MALSKGVNSHVTVAEADAYFADRLDVAEWLASDEPGKSNALVTATGLMENIPWMGTVVSETQPLAFPRVGSYFDPRVGGFVYLDGETPDRILKATFELAYHLLNNDGILDGSSSVSDIKVGPITISNIQAVSTIPAIVRNLIKPLKVNGGANPWWRAN